MIIKVINSISKLHCTSPTETETLEAPEPRVSQHPSVSTGNTSGQCMRTTDVPRGRRRRRRSLLPAVPGEVKDESGRSLFRFRRRRRRRKPSFLPFYSAGGEEEEQFIRNQEEEDSHWERRQKEEKKVRLMSCGDVLSRG